MSSSHPETCFSLLIRLRDPADHAAWSEFCRLYEPVVHRMARRLGVQNADACDLAQEVFGKVLQAIHRWNPDRKLGRFRTWLHQVVRNQLVDSLRRRRPGLQGTGNTSTVTRLANEPIPSVDDVFQLETRRAAFYRAAEVVQADVTSAVWQAFWLTSVDGVSVDEAAANLGMSVGSIYAARSRVIGRLRRAVQSLLDDDITEEDMP